MIEIFFPSRWSYSTAVNAQHGAMGLGHVKIGFAPLPNCPPDHEIIQDCCLCFRVGSTPERDDPDFETEQTESGTDFLPIDE